MSNAPTSAYLKLHTAIFLFGFTAILGRLIDMTEVEIVWYRLLLTCISMLFLPSLIRQLREIPMRVRWQLAGIGVLVAFHWVFFYGSIKYSNVTVTLSVLATTAFFTSFLEPLFFKTRIKWTEMVLGLMIVPGMYLIFSFGQIYITGILMALLSAILASIFAILNRKMTVRYGSLPITFIELGFGWIVLTVLTPLTLWIYPNATFIPSWSDLGYLAILAVLCTTVAFSISLQALRHVTAFTFNLSINLEPIYGIIMAIFLFDEQKEVSSKFYLGTAIILAAVLIHTWLERRARKRRPKS